jgi:predicted DNA-binding protein (MmcQ/YjbR family)
VNAETLPTGPDPEAITRIILERYPDTVTAQALGATFFSIDEKHWPNFATIVTTDEHDEGAPSNLARPGVFRLNIGVSRETFERLVGSTASPDYAAFGWIVPHPVYAKQHWVSILNPSDAEFRDLVLPLIEEAYERLATVRARHRS